MKSLDHVSKNIFSYLLIACVVLGELITVQFPESHNFSFSWPSIVLVLSALGTVTFAFLLVKSFQRKLTDTENKIGKHWLIGALKVVVLLFAVSLPVMYIYPYFLTELGELFPENIRNMGMVASLTLLYIFPFDLLTKGFMFTAVAFILLKHTSNGIIYGAFSAWKERFWKISMIVLPLSTMEAASSFISNYFQVKQIDPSMSTIYGFAALNVSIFLLSIFLCLVVAENLWKNKIWNSSTDTLEQQG